MDEHEDTTAGDAGQSSPTAPSTGAGTGWDREGAPPRVPDQGYWSRIDRSRWGIIAATAVVALALLVAAGLAVWLVFAPPPADTQPGTGSTIPSTESSASVPPTRSVEASAGVPATGPPGPAGLTRAPFVAYRKAGEVWVSGEHGASPIRAAASAEGVFALSPDGRRLAVLDTVSARLVLVDIASGRASAAGDAMPVAPEWSADSATLVYTRQAPGGAEAVWRVAADGTGAARVIANASRGRFVPGTGTVVALSSRRTDGDTRVALISDGRVVKAPSPVMPDEIVPLAGTICFVDLGQTGAGGALTGPSIQEIRYDGSGSRTVVSALGTQLGAAFARLYASPDGDWLTYAEVGDDGYSRMFAVPRAGGTPVALSPRHDDTPIGWSADGAEILFVEGNTAQGEVTSVMAVHPDGSDRRIIAVGAGL